MNDRDIEDTRQPPDQPEAVYCDECGKEMQFVNIPHAGFHRCNNDFCPGNHEGIAKEMAIKIIELEEDLAETKTKLANRDRELKILKEMY